MFDMMAVSFSKFIIRQLLMNESNSSKPISDRAIWLGVISATLFVLLFGFYYFIFHKPILYGAVYDPPKPAAEIITTDTRGNPFRMSELQGKVVLVYFGYLHCPLECPVTLAHLRQALDSLGANARDVQVVMISTDPLRDTPDAMNDYLVKFNPDFLGITGTLGELSKIYSDYNVVVLEGGETHSSFTYLIDRRGQLRLTYVPDSTPEDIAHDLRIILAEN